MNGILGTQSWQCHYILDDAFEHLWLIGSSDGTILPTDFIMQTEMIAQEVLGTLNPFCGNRSSKPGN